MVARAYNFSAQETVTGGSRIQGQPRLCCETTFQKAKRTKKVASVDAVMRVEKAMVREKQREAAARPFQTHLAWFSTESAEAIRCLRAGMVSV